MLIKLVIIAVMFVILYCLGSGLYFLIKKKPKNLARSLSWRIGLSIGLFLFLLLAASLGWIHPHGIDPGA